MMSKFGTQYFTYTLQSAATATGNGEALDCKGGGIVGVQVTGTFVGTITFEGSVDGTNFVAHQGTKLDDGSAVTTATAAGMFRFDVRGLQLFRARISAYTSGAITAKNTIIGVV